MPLLAAILIFAALHQPAAPAAASPSRYIEVPLKGEFGAEITAAGVRDALRQAKARRAGAIVFILDTPGGRVSDAQAIAHIMEQERADLRYYAIVDRAMSAGVWPLSRCDRVFFSPSAAAGAAVAFSRSESTGKVEVDAKFNAAITAEVAAAADSRGQAGCVYRAMMLKDARLYRWTDGGSPKLASEAPAPAPADLREIDTPQTVLAWTAREAADSGFGTLLPKGDAAALGPALGLADWAAAGDSAAPAMARAAKDLEKKAADTAEARERIDTTRKAVVDAANRAAAQVTAARQADPAAVVTVYYREGSGSLTPESQVKWKEQSDIAMREWNAAQATLTDLDRAVTRAAHAVEDFNKARAREHQARLYPDKPEPIKVDPVDHGLDIRALRKEASDTASRIAANRVRSRL